MFKTNDYVYWAALAKISSGAGLRILYANCESGATAWQATRTEMIAMGLSDKTAEKFTEQKKLLDLQKYEEELGRQEIAVLTIGDSHYPPLLKEISDAPTVLFVKGQLPATAEQMLAVVGSRRLSAYGTTVTLQLCRELTAQGIVLVSGLARGVDALAHHSCLEAGIPTLAVLGTGLSTGDIYPTEHRQLAQHIIKGGGALISQYAPGTAVQKFHFPERNRIIAGLTLGTLVTSAAAQSGALITAYAALDENREVFTVPGPITDPTMAGNNALLKRGAHLVTSMADIHILSLGSSRKNVVSLSSDEQLLINLLNTDPCHIDELVNKSPYDLNKIVTDLTILELKGMVRDIGGKRYIRLW